MPNVNLEEVIGFIHNHILCIGLEYLKLLPRTKAQFLQGEKWWTLPQK